MKVIRLVSNKYFSSNTYIVIKSGHALVVDLGFYDKEFSSILSDYKIDGVILTHKHFDHIQGLKEFQNEYPNGLHRGNRTAGALRRNLEVWHLHL